MLNKILNSRILKFCFSIILIYLAFKKVDIGELGKSLIGVKLWFVILSIVICFVGIWVTSYRWANLLINKPKIKDIYIFSRSSLAASFYGMFFPTSVASDIFKWIIVDDKYVNIPRSKLLGSVILDRLIGFTMYILIGVIMIFFAENLGIIIPLWTKLFFVGVFVVCILFYIALIFFDLSKLFKIKWFKKFESVAELVNKDNMIQILKSIGISFLSVLVWMFQIWLASIYFNTGIPITSILIFMPIISMLLSLPISFAGFGAREQLYILFFCGISNSVESVLLMSTFSGITGILISLIGGLVSLTPDFQKSIKKKN